MPRLTKEKDWDHNCIGNGCRFVGCENQAYPAKPNTPLQSMIDESNRNVRCAKCGRPRLNGHHMRMAIKFSHEFAAPVSMATIINQASPMEWQDVCHFIAQGAINITEGATTIEAGSSIHRAMEAFCAHMRKAIVGKNKVVIPL